MNSEKEILFYRYNRHNAKPRITLIHQIQEMIDFIDNVPVYLAITGSAGMGIAERFSFPFVQEVVVSAEVIQELYPEVRTLIDIGGEDAKVIFFNNDLKPDIRMNGNCAGGTGAFIDQMATLLDISPQELNNIAKGVRNFHPIASRCGVFAKTDVQNLISKQIPLHDIAASIYRAVAFQTFSSLARGTEVKSKVVFTGGPLTFQSELKKAFIHVLGIKSCDLKEVAHPELFPAVGAALHIRLQNNNEIQNQNQIQNQIQNQNQFSSISQRKYFIYLNDLIQILSCENNIDFSQTPRLPPLFASTEEYNKWLATKTQISMPLLLNKSGNEESFFLGIDSGSTTTKIAVINSSGKIAAHYYANNKGNPIQAVILGLKAVEDSLNRHFPQFQILYTAVTGYGEELIRFAFNLDDSLVETIAHYKAAAFFDPDVSFILDIGGQDMKAIFCNQQVIQNIELNESCSSGCGSFIENFAQNLGLEVETFAEKACIAHHPCDLGTRCTVFMNSKVKQALRENASIGDIAAGLAVSVIKNCFQKVLKLTDTNQLGDNIVVQGGSFKNSAVLRALEQYLGRVVIRPQYPELMGAFGAALYAQEKYGLLSKLPKKNEESSIKSSFIGFSNLEDATNFTRSHVRCSGCENQCQISILRFKSGKKYYTGNKCERIFTNSLNSKKRGVNLYEWKTKQIFKQDLKQDIEKNDYQLCHNKVRVGIPRVLNLWEDFPFWNVLFNECGFEVVISDPSTMALAESGYGTVMSENICFPAKIVNGHIMNLIEKRVNRIFYPMVRYNRIEHPEHTNHYNCPIVSGYPEVIQSSIKPFEKFGIPFDFFPMTWISKKQAEKLCWQYFSKLGVSKSRFTRAFQSAHDNYIEVKKKISQKAQKVFKSIQANNELAILLLGRPYHLDALINHKIPEMISALGVHVLTEDIIPVEERGSLNEVEVLTQWTFSNRMYDCALWAKNHPNVEVIQLNSFGCGPDAVSIDEINLVLNLAGKNSTVLRIDEISSPGSVKLRIRSLIESLKMRFQTHQSKNMLRLSPPVFTEKDKKRIILAPEFSPFYTRFLTVAFENEGYKIDVLPSPNQKSIELGLKYSNNDICYPASIVIGDLIQALKSGKYDPSKVAVGITQTGGQCRASTYAALIKKALINAGFNQTPVITVMATTSRLLNEQPDFSLNPIKFNYCALFGIIYADCIAKLYYRTAVREKIPGTSWKLVEKFIDKALPLMKFGAHRQLLSLLNEAVESFNQIPIDIAEKPKVGIVGEIYVKFNPFANNYIVDWLMKRGIEVEVSPLLPFFLNIFVSNQYNHNQHITPRSKTYLTLLKVGDKLIARYLDKVNFILRKFHIPIVPFPKIWDIANEAKRVLCLNHQYGEGWMLSGEIGLLYRHGIKDILCLQPFGCIANHIVAKGVEKKLRAVYPELNVLYLDMDSGTSEVNITNRLEFLIKGAHFSFSHSNHNQKKKALSKISIL